MRLKGGLVLTLSAVLFSSALSVIYIMYSIYQASITRDEVNADVAVVLGAAVYRDEPSPVFEARIKHGIALYQNQKVKHIIFTGGVGNKDNLAESQVAKLYAVTEGVPSEKIFEESSSTRTLDNLIGAKPIMDKKGLKSALLVSDPMHMMRALSMARGLGIEVYSSPTPQSRYKSWKSKSQFLTRETYYYIGHVFRSFIHSNTE